MHICYIACASAGKEKLAAQAVNTVKVPQGMQACMRRQKPSGAYLTRHLCNMVQDNYWARHEAHRMHHCSYSTHLQWKPGQEGKILAQVS